MRVWSSWGLWWVQLPMISVLIASAVIPLHGAEKPAVSLRDSGVTLTSLSVSVTRNGTACVVNCKAEPYSIHALKQRLGGLGNQHVVKFSQRGFELRFFSPFTKAPSEETDLSNLLKGQLVDEIDFGSGGLTISTNGKRGLREGMNRFRAWTYRRSPSNRAVSYTKKINASSPTGGTVLVAIMSMPVSDLKLPFLTYVNLRML